MINTVRVNKAGQDFECQACFKDIKEGDLIILLNRGADSHPSWKHYCEDCKEGPIRFWNRRIEAVINDYEIKAKFHKAYMRRLL